VGGADLEEAMQFDLSENNPGHYKRVPNQRRACGGPVLGQLA
jgi:hypothetical protein